MQIRLTSILVDDQEKALRFYTDVLGFVRKTDLPMGEHRWLTVTAPEGAEGVELVLEPTAFAPAAAYQQALFDAGIPATAFLTHDLAAEYERLSAGGVRFRSGPTAAGPNTAALFEDTCGNLISLVEPGPA